MDTGAERSNSLHDLRWGNQRFLRCLKVNSDCRISLPRRFAASNSDQHLRNNCSLQSRKFLRGSRTSPPASDISRRFSGHDDGIAATREKVILDLQTAAEAMKDAIFKDSVVYKYPPPPIASVESALRRPWNLRMRRTDSKPPTSRFVSSTTNVEAAAAAGGDDGIAGGKEPAVNESKSNFGKSQLKAGLSAVIDKPMRLRSGGGAAASGGKKERPKFSVTLTKSEIEEDFYSMVGHRPPRRPKKRHRNVQRQLDTLFPGLWLSEVTPDMYN